MKYKLGQPLTEKEWQNMSKEDDRWLQDNDLWYCYGFNKIISMNDVHEDGEYSKQWLTDMKALSNFDLLWYAWMNSNSQSIDDVLCDAYRDVSRMSRKEWNEWVDEMDMEKVDFSLTRQEVIE